MSMRSTATLCFLLGIAAPLASSGATPEAPACPYSALKPRPATPTGIPSLADPTCLTDWEKIPAGVAPIDIRSLAEHLSDHVPGDEHASLMELLSRNGDKHRPIVLYDSGRFRHDAFAACDRMRKAGFDKVKVVDGGIARWAQSRSATERARLNRLDDASIADAMLDGNAVVTALAPGYDAVLATHAIKTRILPGAKWSRRILLTTPSTSMQSVDRELADRRTLALYWVGTPDNLHALLDRQLALARKREAGPAESTVCDNL